MKVGQTKIIDPELSNAQDVAYVHVNSWKAAYKGIVPDDYLDGLSVGKSAQRFKEIKAKGKAHHYLMYVDEKPAGVFVFSKSFDEDADKDTADIGAIYFLPEYWGKGFGTKLIDFGIAEIKKTGYKAITLWVLEQNIRARKFYEKKGFVFDGTKEDINIGKQLVKVRYRMDIR